MSGLILPSRWRQQPQRLTPVKRSIGCIGAWHGGFLADGAGLNPPVLETGALPAVADGRRCYQFDPSTDFNIAKPALNISGGYTFPRNEATVILWVKLRLATPTEQAQTGFIKLDAAGGSYPASHYPWIDGSGYISTFRATRVDGIALSGAVDRTRWHQVAISSKPGAGGWNMYQNGILVSSQTGDATISFNAAAAYLGYSLYPAGHYGLDGWLDNASLWDVALSAEQIRALYYDEWQIFEPAHRALYFDASPAPAQPSPGLKILYGPDLLLRGFTPAHDLNFTLVEKPAVINQTEGYGTSGDLDTLTLYGDITANNFLIGIQSTLGHSLENLTPAVCDLDAQGNVTLVSVGEAQILITDSLNQKRLIRRPMATTGAGSTIGTYFNGFRAGSLGAHITAAMQALVSGKTPCDASMDAHSANNYNPAAPAVTRNTGLFCAGLDLTAISVINGAGYTFPGALISPRHVLGAWHAPQPSPLVFKRPDGSYATANILSRQRIDASDLSVAYLDAAITGITPLPVLPANWQTYLAKTGAVNMKLPVLSKTIHRPDGSVRDQWNINTVTHINGTRWAYGEIAHMPCWCTYQPTLGTEPWYSKIIGGDSGGPVLVPINGALALLGTYYTAASLPLASLYITDIEAAMNALAAAQGHAQGYSLAQVGLGGFNAY